jgi:hypothetical protein
VLKVVLRLIWTFTEPLRPVTMSKIARGILGTKPLNFEARDFIIPLLGIVI